MLQNTTTILKVGSRRRRQKRQNTFKITIVLFTNFRNIAFLLRKTVIEKQLLSGRLRGRGFVRGTVVRSHERPTFPHQLSTIQCHLPAPPPCRGAPPPNPPSPSLCPFMVLISAFLTVKQPHNRSTALSLIAPSVYSGRHGPPGRQVPPSRQQRRPKAACKAQGRAGAPALRRTRRPASREADYERDGKTVRGPRSRFRKSGRRQARAHVVPDPV